MKNKHNFNRKNTWAILLLSSVIGLIASFVQAIERIDYAKNPKLPLSCDVNSVFSCSNVFDAWQSSVFGFSNSLMCIVFFTLILGVALAGITGSLIKTKLKYLMQFFSLFFLGFGAWYLHQSAFVIDSLCIFCIFCYSAVIAINWAWLRLNVADYKLSQNSRNKVNKALSSGIDTFLWVLWAIIIASMLYVGIKY